VVPRSWQRPGPMLLANDRLDDCRRVQVDHQRSLARSRASSSATLTVAPTGFPDNALTHRAATGMACLAEAAVESDAGTLQGTPDVGLARVEHAGYLSGARHA